MTRPSLTVDAVDNAGNIANGAIGLPPAALGICTRGTVGQVYRYGDAAAMAAALGEGPLVAYAARYLTTSRPAIPPKPLIAIPVNPSTFGANGSVTHTGTGTGTVTLGLAPRRQISVSVPDTGGALGVAVMRFQVGDDTPFDVTSAAGWSSTGYVVPGTLTKLVFTAGNGYDVGDEWTISPTGVITQTANGTSSSAGYVFGGAGPFTILPTEHWNVAIDQGAAQVFTFDGTRGYKDGSGGVFAGVAGTVVVRVDEQASALDITVTFDGSENSLAKALQRLNDYLAGATALDNGSSQVRIRSDRYGDSSTIRVVSGTGALLTDLGLAAGLGTAGTATCDKDGGGAQAFACAFLDAATRAEVVAGITAAGDITGGALTNDATGYLKLVTDTTGASPKGVQVDAGSAELLGFDTDEHNGATSSTGTIGSQTSSPLDAVDAQIEILTDGTLDEGEFRYSLDNGDNWSGRILLPSGAKYALGESGIFATFAGDFVDGDLYAWSSTGPSASASDYSDAIDALLATTYRWDHVLPTEQPATAAAAATLAAAMAQAMSEAAVANKWGYVIIGCPQTEAGADIAAAFDGTIDPRLVVVCGDNEAQNATGRSRLERRPGAWDFSMRCAAIPISRNPLATADGALPGVTETYRDQRTDGTDLDAEQFVTMTTWENRPGVYITKGRMKSGPTSDYQVVQYRRVIDAACRIVFDNLFPSIGRSLRLLTDGSGYIDPRDADELETLVNTALTAQLVNAGHCSGARAVISRTTDLSGEETPLPVAVRIVMLKYADVITVEVGISRSL